MWETIWDILLDTLMDTAEIIPILFLAYLLMEFLERHMSERTTDLVRKSGRFGPVIGSLLGAFPQCGFSAAASSLYAGRVITVGTLIAVYLSTSDEMLPILLSEHVPAATILRILGLVLCGLSVHTEESVKPHHLAHGHEGVGLSAHADGDGGPLHLCIGHLRGACALPDKLV